MKKNIYRYAALAGLIAAAMLPAGSMIAPAAAQIGGIVHDPRNYAQNILTAARTLEQINNQIKQLQNQATSLVNEARNLQSLPTSTLQELQGQVDRTRGLLAEAQRIAFDVGDQDGLKTDTGKLHDALDAYGIQNTFEIYSGTHTSAVAVRFQNFVMPFFSKNLCAGADCK